jgi:hypothetical protein
LITKLTITPCSLDDKGNVTGPRTGEAFTVRLNPSNYTRNFEITYNPTTAMGAAVMQPRFNGAGEKKMEFEIVMDGTGVVPPTSPNSTAIDIDTQLGDLRKVIYTLDGEEHEPNTVMLVWGSFSFVGKLSTMSVEYTLFKPTGDPLRAKVKLSFIQYIGPTEAANAANLRSPDLTHAVEVQAGDSLPLLCFRIYKNSAYYLEVAKFNGITNFRNIKPGTRLNFPPLR